MSPKQWRKSCLCVTWYKNLWDMIYFYFLFKCSQWFWYLFNQLRSVGLSQKKINQKYCFSSVPCFSMHFRWALSINQDLEIFYCWTDRVNIRCKSMRWQNGQEAPLTVTLPTLENKNLQMWHHLTLSVFQLLCSDIPSSQVLVGFIGAAKET